jgi:hypothetical protein
MKTFALARYAFAFLGVSFLGSSLHAQLIGVSGSTAAAPAVFGGYAMTQFADDIRPDFHEVSSVVSPLGGALKFSSKLDHVEIGEGWQTWSNGYEGDVYFFGFGKSLTLTLPKLTKAFYFYAEPNCFAPHNITASSGGVVLSEEVTGKSGAEFFGFYATGTSALTSITITSNDQAGFAIGEFGIGNTLFVPSPFVSTAVPEPSTYALTGALALCGLAAARRFKRGKI